MIGVDESSKDTGLMLPGFETCETATALWPTPSARDWRSGKHSEATAERNARPLNEAVWKRSTLSAVASPASPSVTPADGQENPIAAGFGLSSTESFARYDPDGCSSRTSPVCGVSPPSSLGRLTDAYAAGLFDGEGCVYIAAKGKWHYPRTDIGMTMKGKPLLEMMAKKYGGKLRRYRKATDKWEEAWTWTLLNRDTERFLRAIQPHLVIKHEQVRLTLKFLEMVAALPPRGTRTDHRKWSEEAFEAAAAIKAEIQSLNKTGPQHARQAGWFARLVGGIWITPQLSLVPGLPWERFSGTWPKRGTMRSGSTYPLPTSERPTTESESLSWPTPDVPNGGRGAVRWPTPTARLGDQRGPQAKRYYDPERSNDLDDAVAATGISGQLNVDWVSLLMGFPMDWCVVDGSVESPEPSKGRKTG